MKTALLGVLLIGLAAALPASPARAQDKASGKAKVLAKIEARLKKGDYDGAKRMIDFFLEKNPGDPDLVKLLEKWRRLKGDATALLTGKNLANPENRRLLRKLCFLTVTASMAGNPEEWEALLFTGDKAKARELLAAATKRGGPEDRRTAKALLVRLDGKAPPSPTAEQLKAAIAGSDPAAAVCAFRAVEKGKLEAFRAAAARAFKGHPDLEVRTAAAAALLALGVESPRKQLRAALRGRPVQAVFAMEALIRHPGKGKRPLQDLFAAIRADEEILGVKGTLLSLAVRGIGETREAGGRGFLEKLLGDPDFAVDAARALGAYGDPAAVPALLTFLRHPPKPKEDDTTGSGLGFLGGSGRGVRKAAAAEELRPRLVGALAILRVTADGK